MPRTASLSGFPEFLPRERMIELHVLDMLRQVFELHGFASIETRAVETVEQLLQKGEIDKEVYAVRRLQADEGVASASEPGLALHFDLTVPFSRYVVENAGHLNFPFRRYQIQKAWRGERPQEGRAREFTQADIDVVSDGELSSRYDVELVLVAAKALSALPLSRFTMRVNNRKLTEGFYRGLGLTDTAGVLRCIDKLEKIGPRAVAGLLRDKLGAEPEQVRAALDLAAIRTSDLGFADRVRALGVNDPLIEEGIAELSAVLEAALDQAPGMVVADLSIARGLDYYTGTVVETMLDGQESLGSICSGGRYDALARKGSRTFPGVGLSIGVSRILARLIGQGTVTASRPVPTAVYIALTDDEDWPRAQRLADVLRSRGIAVEAAVRAEKFGKQIKYADRRGIPFVWFLAEEHGQHQVKDLRSGEQITADPARWMPPPADLTVRIE